MDNAQCSNCGAPLARRNSASRLITCTSCDTTQMFADDVFRNAGTQGAMQDVPTLFKLGETVRVEGLDMTPLGHARFSYGRGWWDEFWCEAGERMLWISVDEGDCAIEEPLDPRHIPRNFRPTLGAQVEINGSRFTVTEAETAECVAIRGEFPEVLSVGERHLYFDLSSARGGIVTLEQWDNESAWFKGHWIDPWIVGSKSR